MQSTRLTHLFLLCFDEPNVIWCTVKVPRLLIIHFSPISCYFLPARHKYFPRHHILEHWRCSFKVRDPHKATGSIIVQVSDILWELILAPTRMFLFCPPTLSFSRDLKVLTAVLLGIPVAWEVILCRWRFVSDVSKQRSAFVCNRQAVSWRWKHCVAWER